MVCKHVAPSFCVGQFECRRSPKRSFSICEEVLGLGRNLYSLSQQGGVLLHVLGVETDTGRLGAVDW